MIDDIQKVDEVSTNVAAISEEQAASADEIQETSQKMVEQARAITQSSQDVADNSHQLANTSQTLTGYVQQSLFDRQALDDAISCFPISGTTITYTVSEAEERDWNEEWEKEGFQPIVINGGSTAEGTAPTVIIHDGRHLPTDVASLSPTLIEIDAKMAFGTGTHETTRMICTALTNIELAGKYVLDCGCGTGILGICALKLGAAHCTAYDIDEWSVDNTLHNAVINGVDNRLEVLHGNATLLDDMTARYDIVTANINRNILLEDMPGFVRMMRRGSLLLLSGFYVSDCQQLQERAETLSLEVVSVRSAGDWAMMVFSLK
jgi:ribosomal protein L11 methyltransferase